MNRAYKDILIKKYDAFDWEEGPDRKKRLRSEVVNILSGIDQPDSEDLYIWGLTYYMSEDEKEYHRPLALEKFLEAYKLDSDNFLACLYIAHCFHDIGKLQHALKYYELVDKNAVKEFQIWRYVKLIEQIGYCNHQLGNQALGRKQFQEVLEWYRKLPPDDRAVPSELLACLPESDEIVLEMKAIERYLN